MSHLVGLLGSALLHGFVALYLSWAATTPDLGFELELPSEVEFGLTEEMAAAPVAPMPAPLPPPPPAEPASDEGPGEKNRPADAGTPKPKDAAAPHPKDAGQALARADSVVTDGGQPATGAADAGSAVLPAGAQLALRFDMVRVRASPLAPKVRSLLMAIPDWQIMLDGSGIDPLDDLTRVLIASPDLSRTRAIIAGQHPRDEAFVRATVARMAAARGEPARWTTMAGVPTAPWRDRDSTPRVVAMVGHHHFAVSRPEDLPKVLAVAEARRKATDGGAGGPEVDAWGKALLAMPEGSALSFEVEGVQKFVRGRTAADWPIRGRASIREAGEGGAMRVVFDVVGEYESPEDAARAQAFWDRVRTQYAQNPMVSLMGLGRPLREAELSVDGARLRVETALTVAQITLILDLIRAELERFQERRDEGSPSRERPRPAAPQMREPAGPPPDVPPAP